MLYSTLFFATSGAACRDLLIVAREMFVQTAATRLALYMCGQALSSLAPNRPPFLDDANIFADRALAPGPHPPTLERNMDPISCCRAKRITGNRS